MKTHILCSVFLVLFSIGKTVAQNYLPLATTGYSLDGVAENTTAISTTGGALDASDFVLYSQYYGTLFSSNAVGLPNNGLIASGTRTYQLQPYTGFNVMHILSGAKDSLTLLNPQPYPIISLLGFGSQGAATASITVRFTDNSIQVFSPITMDDWFTANPSIYNGFDRALRTTGAPAYVASAGNPRLFAFDLAISCLNLGKPVKRIIVQNNSGGAHICVMAVSATLPTYSTNANPPFLCNSGSTTLTAIGLTSYTWQPVGTFLGSNANTVNVSPTSTTIYTLLGTDAFGCGAYSTVTVNVSGVAPSLSLTGSSSSVCLGAAATLSASGAVSYTWTGGVTNGVPFTPSVTTTYTVSGQNGCGTSTTVRTITVGPLPVTLMSTSTVVCTNNSATLSALASASSYTWLPGTTAGTMSSIVINPTITTIYSIAVSNGICLGNATINIQANPIPTITASSSSGSLCPGESAILTSSGGINYTWTPINSNNSSISVSPTVTTTYTVVGNNSVGCLNSSILTINVGIIPNMLLSASSMSICNGSSCTLTASAANSYTWTNGPISNTFVVSPTQSTTYTVSGTNLSSGCNDTKTIDIYVFTPTIFIAGSTTVCSGSSISFTAFGANSYNWQPGGLPFASVTFTPITTSIYTLNTLTTSGILNCSATTTLGVNVSPLPTLTTSIKKSVLCVKETNTLSVGGASTYVWSSGSTTLSGSSILIAPQISGTLIYTVTGTDAMGCIAMSVLQMTVSKCTGIEKYSNQSLNISIYPNPSNSRVTVQSEFAIDLRISNDLGQNIRFIKLEESNEYMEVIEGLSTGIYFISSNDEAILFRKKIIITK